MMTWIPTRMKPGRPLWMLLVALLTTQAQAQEIYSITQPSITACSGALVDSGGEGNPGYQNNENLTTTICPDEPGNAISLQFVVYSLSLQGNEPFDVITVYDGNSTSAPVLGVFNGSQNPPILSGSFENPTGCLTVSFTSNATGTGAFAAVITCSIPCDPPTAVAQITGEPIPALVCQNEVLSFNAAASFAAPGRTIVEYKWDFDDGTPMDSTSGASVQHAFEHPGEYVVQLILTDDIGCTNVNLVDLQVLVSTTPSFNAFASDTVICQGNTITLDASGVQPTTWSAAPVADFGDGIYLPDDVGTPFTSQITFTGFTPGQTLQNIDQFTSICISMEHSFMGDFVLTLTSPSGQSTVLHQQGGGGTFLGDANDNDNANNPVPGTCWEYCFAPNATNPTWVDAVNQGMTMTPPSTIWGNALIPGTYSSIQPLANLVGSPLNGSWTLTFVDLWGADNGFICSWNINFDPSLYPDLVEFTPVLGVNSPDTAIWAGTPSIVHNPATPLVVTATPDQDGVAVYAFSITDNFGCTYDTTITVLVNPSPGANPVITGDAVVCEGQGTVLTVQGEYPEYNWNNGYNGAVVLVGPGTYTVEAGAGDCVMESQPFVVTAVEAPEPVIVGELFNCSGQPEELSTTETYATYQWSTGAQTPTVFVGTGTYTVTVTNQEGCTTTSAPVTVNAATPPSAVFAGSAPNVVNPGTEVVYAHDGSGVPVVFYQWTVDSVLVGTGATYTTLWTEPGDHVMVLTVTTAEGCTHSFTYIQTVIPEEIIVPNVFSPNGDGKNDRLTFEGAQYYPNTSLSVFNRWGKEVFSSGNYKNTWTAADMPDGTYFYVLKLFTGKEYTGHVTLLR